MTAPCGAPHVKTTENWGEKIKDITKSQTWRSLVSKRHIYKIAAKETNENRHGWDSFLGPEGRDTSLIRGSS